MTLNAWLQHGLLSYTYRESDLIPTVDEMVEHQTYLHVDEQSFPKPRTLVF